jgi:hypothetical protein
VYEDIVEQPPVAQPQQNFVVSDVVVSAIGAEVEHEERHGVAQAADAAVAIAAAEARRRQLEIGVRHVRVADDGVGGQCLPARQPHAGCAADSLVHDDLARLAAKRQRPAALHEERRSARQSRRAAGERGDASRTLPRAHGSRAPSQIPARSMPATKQGCPGRTRVWSGQLRVWRGTLDS